MSQRPHQRQESWPARMARYATDWSGSTMAFSMAVLVIVLWLATGPLFQFSDTWQLVINTSTTIITFLMVFLIQRAQNKDAHAVHLKLNELLAAIHGASNRLINVEDLSEREITLLHQHFAHLAALALRESDLTLSHSIEEATHRHHRKRVATAEPIPTTPTKGNEHDS